MLNVTLINGSVRENNMTGKILLFVENEIKKILGLEIININLKDFNLPFPGMEIENDNSNELKRLLSLSDSFIIATPEYNGSFSAKLKLMIENSGYPSKLKGKPILLIGVADGSLGAVKSLEHLRSVCSHIGGIVLPKDVSIANVNDAFDTQGNCIKHEIKEELISSLNNFISFTKHYLK